MASPIYILGGYQTDFARSWAREGLDISDIVKETTLGTLDAAALDAGDIRSIHVGNAFGELHRNQGHLGSMVAQVVPELWGVPAMRHEGACASSSLGILAATAEIEAGRYDCVLVLGAEEEKNVPGDAASQIQNSAGWNGREDIECRFMWPRVFALLAEEYDRRYGLDPKYLRAISKNNFNNAKRNPLAQTRRWEFNDLSFTDDDNANPFVEVGMRRNDCSQITDGGCGVILASPEFAQAYAQQRGLQLDQLPYIAGWGHRNAGLRYLDKISRSQDHSYIFPHVRQTIEDAWLRAGITLDDVDGIETHDCFSSTEYMAIDHFGITAPGQSWQAVDDGSIYLGGRLPVNPSGGLMGGGHPVGATGARMIFDAAKQVTGKAGDYQVDGARTFATLNIGGSCATVASFVVRTDN